MFSVLSVICVLSFLHCSLAQECDSQSCKCQLNSGLIDLSSLATSVDYSISGTDGSYTYYYNPCIGLDIPSCPSGSAVCQENAERTIYFSTGSIYSEQIVVDNSGEIFIEYTGGDDDRMSIIKLTCDQNVDPPNFVVHGESTPLEYDFELITKCACPNMCSPSKPPSGGGSHKNKTTPAGEVGIVLMVIAIVALVTYFVVGGIILHQKYEKNGMDLIPQKQLWLSLPLLVKDGVLFTFSPIIRLIKKDQSYEPIKS